MGEDYNLLGQKLGPKGRQARERLREAALALMVRQPMTPPTLTAVATEAGVKLTAVYRYYSDVGALFLDAMKPLRAEMEPVTALLKQPWQPGAEYTQALDFAERHFDYWRERRGALFLRNSLAEGGDARFIDLRVEWATPLYRALAGKLAAAHGRAAGARDMAIAGLVLSGMERTTTLVLQHWDEDGTGNASAVARQADMQRQALAQIITMLLQHEYLPG